MGFVPDCPAAEVAAAQLDGILRGAEDVVVGLRGGRERFRPGFVRLIDEELGTAPRHERRAQHVGPADSRSNKELRVGGKLFVPHGCGRGGARQQFRSFPCVPVTQLPPAKKSIGWTKAG